MAERYVRAMQDMYEDRVTAVRCQWFSVEVGFHQAQNPDPFLFCSVDGQLDGRDQTGISEDYDICGRVEDKIRHTWRSGGTG